jgi:primosomal protein N' (replication factor Y)
LGRIFRSRFGNQVAVLHSGLSDGERYDQWNRIREGDAQVAIGARSAIFAPFSHLGLIVVDEEHDATYKQEEIPRYHARDVAVVRAKMVGAAVVLGSATPSVESFYHARSGKYRYLTLQKRIEDRPLPEVSLIDMKEVKGVSPLSPKLTEAVQQGLEREEQVLLFLNRRGYAPFLICSTCGHVLICPNCSVSLTYHLKEKRVSCHHCDFSTFPTNICPECRCETLELKGCGTERIQKEVEDLFQESVLLRLDRDTTRRKGAAKKILDQFRSRKGDILIGTQMVAKGHHLPGISLVGVLNADTALHFPDFRSGERTFQVLTQVAGRAGRGESMGRVYLQSYTPEHYSIQAARHHDYQRFYDQEVQIRESMNYPPYCRLINIVLSANTLEKVEKASSDLGQILRKLNPRKQRVEILGPARAPLSTLRGKKRCQILVKGKTVRSLHHVVDQGIAHFKSRNGFPGVDLIVDVDPVSFL